MSDEVSFEEFQAAHAGASFDGLNGKVVDLNTREPVEKIKPAWHSKLQLTKAGSLKANLLNVMTVLANDQNLAGLKFNEWTARAEWTAPNAWRHQPGQHGDHDDSMLRAYLSESYELDVGAEMASQAVNAVANERPYDPVVQHFDGLVWDGTARLDNWLAYYLGCSATKYARLVGAKFLISAVALTIRQPQIRLSLLHFIHAFLIIFSSQPHFSAWCWYDTIYSISNSQLDSRCLKFGGSSPTRS